MHIKESADLLRFLQTINNCREDVYFTTDEGDVLNLKSQLSRFVFAAIASDRRLLEKGEIICGEPDDLQILKHYLEE